MNKYVKYLKDNKVPENIAKDMLDKEQSLTDKQKSIIYAYCYPRYLGDYMLPEWIKEVRNISGNKSGVLAPDFEETKVLIEACGTEQYGRFMKHLMHSFLDPEKVHPISGNETTECPICGKKLYEHDLWQNLVTEVRPGTPEKEKREYLSYGSEESKLTMCIDCMIQLKCAYDILQQLDPGFLDWKLRN